jgi:autotransporter adhesin
MKSIIFGILALAFSETVAHAGQWDDAIQWEDVNLRQVFYPTGSPTTNIAIAAQGEGCGTHVFAEFAIGGIYASCDGGGALTIDINQFARQGDVLALQLQVANFTTAMGQINQNLHMIAQRSDQGIAMSLAMAGVADLQTDEHFAVSANWGTFRGQNSAAFGVAYRVADHVSVSGGLVGSLNGGSLGGRAGIRFGW